MQEGYGCVCFGTKKRIPCPNNSTHLKSVQLAWRNPIQTHKIVSTAGSGGWRGFPMAFKGSFQRDMPAASITQYQPSARDTEVPPLRVADLRIPERNPVS